MIALLFWLLVEGAAAPPVQLVDQDGHTRAVPGPRPVLLIYEDHDGNQQNRATKELLGRLNSKQENQARVDVLAVADLEKWNWWPARKYALADIQKQSRAKNTTIYVDWKGDVRRAYGLAKGKSHLILLGSDGKVRFVSEGECSPSRVQRLLGELAKFGFVP